jgi:hypothetical protein
MLLPARPEDGETGMDGRPEEQIVTKRLDSEVETAERW